ncbi:MAG: branched-chain alpha-keto acid dehydrogenase subunit E2, partial [Nitrospiraceae bacterium]
MPTDIIMPQLGESIAEGTIVKWLIPPGGRIEKDQPLLEVETDKVALEIPSPAAGVLTEVIVKEGQKVPVGTLLGRIGGEQARTEVINRVGGVVVKPSTPVQEGAEHHSPAVRQLAKEHGVDLSQVTGTGEGGRVTKKDILDFIEKHKESRPSDVSPQPSATRGVEEEIISFTTMRKTIAERMLKSRQTSAHVTTFFEADFSGVARFRQERGLTYLPFVIKAI